MKSKRILLLASIALSAFTFQTALNAQMQKGTWLTESNIGNLEFRSFTNEAPDGSNYFKTDIRTFSFSFGPTAGYFLTDQVVLGSLLNISFTSHKQESYHQGVKSLELTNNGSTLGLIPFVRYYFGKPSKNMFYGQVGVGASVQLFNRGTSTFYGSSGEPYGTSTSSSDTYGIAAHALMGFNHFFTENLAFNSSIGYFYSQNNLSGISNSTFSNSGSTQSASSTRMRTISWHIGFTMLIGRKQAE